MLQITIHVSRCVLNYVYRNVKVHCKKSVDLHKIRWHLNCHCSLEGARGSSSSFGARVPIQSLTDADQRTGFFLGLTGAFNIDTEDNISASITSRNV